MTQRGAYLKALVDPNTGRISVRELAKRLAERPELPTDSEKIRRTLQRHMEEGDNGRDVSDKYVAAISAVLELSPDDWPAATRSPTNAALRQRVAELEAELRRARHGDPPDRAQGAGP